MTMPLSFRFRPARAVVLALLLAALLSAFLWAGSVPAQGNGGVDLDAVDLPPLRYPNLGSRLSWMAQDVEDGTAADAEAAARAVEYDGTSVGVRITFSGGQEALGNFLAEVGGSVDYVSGDSMKAWVPVAELGRLSRLPITVEVRESVPPQPAGPLAMGSVKSQGVRLHGADVWHQMGFTGSGVKVGILDVGFAGFSDLVRSGELPRPVGVYCGVVKVSNPNGVSDSQIDACALDWSGDLESHGTATAETIADMAPGAQLYISNKGYVLGSDWFRTLEVDVVNASLKPYFDSPPVGVSGPVKSSIKSFVDPTPPSKGGVWVNAAGNDASGANWFSRVPFLDQDNDGYIEFVPGDESNNIILEDSSLVGLRWDPTWQGSAQNIGLFVHDGNGVINERMSSYGPGSGSHRLAGIDCEFVYPCVIQLGIRVTGTVSHPSWIQLEISHFESLQHHIPDNSMGNPGEMSLDGFLAVGASGYRSSGTVIERYSSRGPVPGATYTKPDLEPILITQRP